MKKLLVLFMILIFTLAMPLSAFAKNDKGPEASVSTVQTENTDTENTVPENTYSIKQFKQEMNQAKKALGDLQGERDTLQAEYDTLKATAVPTDATEAASRETKLAELQAQIDSLDTTLTDTKAAKKQLINERYMVMKSQYTDEQLAAEEITSADALVDKLYNITEEDITVTAKKNLIKFEAPSYMKGGKLIFNLNAIASKLGAECTYDETTQAISITTQEGTFLFTVKSALATITQFFTGTDEEASVDETVDEDATVDEETDTDVVDEEATATEGTEIGILTQAKMTCGRAFVAVKALAEYIGIDIADEEENATEDADEITDDTDEDTTVDADDETPDDESADDTADDTEDPVADETTETADTTVTE